MRERPALVATSLDELATLLGLDAAVQWGLRRGPESDWAMPVWDYWRDQYRDTYRAALTEEERDVLGRELDQRGWEVYRAAATRTADARRYLAELPLAAVSREQREPTWRLVLDGVWRRFDGVAWVVCEAPPPELPPEPREAELDAAICDDPLDDARYAVIADFLQEHGDPRGELAALQLAVARQNRHEQHARIAALMNEHENRWLGRELRGPLEAQWRRDPDVLVWRAGFIHGLRIARRPAHALIAATRAHPSGRFLASLVLRAVEDLADVFALLPQLPALRELAILGAPTRGLSLAPTWQALHRMRSLELRADIALGAIVLPAVQVVRYGPGFLDREAVASLETAVWPQLETLELDVGACADTAKRPLVAWLRGLDLPRLTTLQLQWDGHCDALCEAIATAPVRHRLRVLSLRGAGLTPHGVRQLLAAGLVVDELALETDGLGPVGRKLLEPLLETVRARRRR